MNFDGLAPEAVKDLYEPIRGRFEAELEAVASLPETQVLAGLVLRLYRLFLAVEALTQVGLFEESNATMRSAAEAIVNLMYVMDAGEARPKETRTSRQLAEMFVAYGDVAYYKLIGGRGEHARGAFRRRLGWSEAQIDAHRDECRRKRDAALALGCGEKSWHPLGLTDMAKHVLLHLPDYAEPRFADLLLSCFASGNSAVHGDALSLRTQYNDLGAHALQFIPKGENSNLNAASALVTWAWRRLARYLGDEEWLRKSLDGKLREIALRRWDSSPPADVPRILLPGDQ